MHIVVVYRYYNDGIVYYNLTFCTRKSLMTDLGLYDYLLLRRFCRYICFRSILATLWMEGCGRCRSCIYRSFLAY